LLEKTYPDDIRIIRAAGLPARLTRWAGIGNLWWRCGRALARTGERLLAEERFDLVFFSTTQFSAFQLGSKWRRRFGVPYVLDYQDPWINPYYHQTHTAPPGGRIKFALSQFVARRIEPDALRNAGGIISVSDAYARGLAEAYPWFDPARVQLLPFGAAPADFAAVRLHQPAKPLIDFSSPYSHYVYTGRCGPDMTLAMTVLFRAFKLFLTSHPEKARNIRFHFIGTDYAPPPLGRYWALPIARAEGVADYVNEHCYRVSYFDALHYLTSATALLGVGSNDPTYAASKIFPYILANRPMLLIYHEQSLVLKFASRVGAGMLFRFSGPKDIDSLAALVHSEWFAAHGRDQFQPYDVAAFRPFTAEALTCELADVFNRAAASARPAPSMANA
jgi:glycosyl transferase family 4